MLLNLLCVLCLLVPASAGAAELRYRELWRVTGKGGFSAPNYLVDGQTGKPRPGRRRGQQQALGGGVEDYEYLCLLRAAVSAAQARGAGGPALEQAQALLAALPGEVEAALHKVGRVLPLTPDGVPAYDAATQPLRAARRRIVEACLALRER